MSIINFIIVLGFNIYWLKIDYQCFIDMYNGNFSKWFSLCFWLYALWGIINLIDFIIDLINTFNK